MSKITGTANITFHLEQEVPDVDDPNIYFDGIIHAWLDNHGLEIGEQDSIDASIYKEEDE